MPASVYFPSQGDRRRTCSSSRQRPEKPGDSMKMAARYTLIESGRVSLLINVFFVFFQMVNLLFCVLLIRHWRSWQTATELTAMIWQRSSLSIHVHKKKSVRSGVCVCMYMCVFWIFSLCFNVLQWICHNRSVVSELKEEVRKRILREHEPTSGKSCLLLQLSQSHRPWVSNLAMSLFCFLTQGHHHSPRATAEGSELRRQALTLKTLAQPQALLRSAQMICPGWMTRTLVRKNVPWMKNAPKHIFPNAPTVALHAES